MKATFTILSFFLFIAPALTQQDRAIRDTGGGGAGGGIYDPGSGTLPANIRASGGSSEYKVRFDSISFLEILDWNEGLALRILQDFSGATKFGRGIVYTDGADSLDISMTATGEKLFTIDATTELNVDAPNTVFNPDSVSFNIGNGTFTDNRAGLGGATHGIKYANVDVGDLVSNSLVPKSYVDGEIGDIPTATSGYAEMTGTSTQSMSTSFAKFNTMASGDLSSEWTFSAGNDDLTYSGATARYLLQFSASADLPTLSINELTIAVRENGTNTTAIGKAAVNDTGLMMNISGVAIITANSGDVFDIGGSVASSTGNIDLDYCQVVLTKLVGE